MNLGARPLWEVLAHAYAYLVEPHEAALANLAGEPGAQQQQQQIREALDRRLHELPRSAEDEWGMDPASEAANRWLDTVDLDG